MRTQVARHVQEAERNATAESKAAADLEWKSKVPPVGRDGYLFSKSWA